MKNEEVGGGYCNEGVGQSIHGPVGIECIRPRVEMPFQTTGGLATELLRLSRMIPSTSPAKTAPSPPTTWFEPH